MSYYISPLGHSLLPYPDFKGFKPSCMTMSEGSSILMPDTLFRLCISSVISSGRGAMFVDGWNTFNPYAFSKIAKSFGAKPRKVLSRIHIAGAFIEYQMDAVFLSILVEQEKELNSKEDRHVPAGHQVRSEKQPDNKMD